MRIPHLVEDSLSIFQVESQFAFQTCHCLLNMIQENQIYLIRNKKSNNVIVLTQGEDTVLNMGASNPVL